jgi:solute carrier family 25 (mitochondrial S-adenosylmethionine transporter), member 26
MHSALLLFLSPLFHAIGSSVAQLMNCVIVTLAEVLKQSAQVLAHDYRKKREVSLTMEVMRQLKKHPAKLWRGYTVPVARDLPFTAQQFPAPEHLKKILIARRLRLKGGEPVNGTFECAKISPVSTSIAGSAAAWIATPVDIIKTRMMLSAGQNTQNEHPGKGLLDGQNRDAARRNPFQIGKDVFVKKA